VVIPDHADELALVILTTVVGSSGNEALPRRRYRRLRSAWSGWLRTVPDRAPGRVVRSDSRSQRPGVASPRGKPCSTYTLNRPEPTTRPPRKCRTVAGAHEAAIASPGGRTPSTFRDGGLLLPGEAN
jgi:hypothetical protein